MFIGWTVTVIFLNNFIEKFVESSVRIVRTSIKTDTRIKIGDSTETASFESYSRLAWLIFVFIPNFLCKISWNSWIGIRFKETFKVVKTISSFVLFEIINSCCWLFFYNWSSNWLFNLSWFSLSLLNWFWLSLSYWFWLSLSGLLLLNWSSLRNLLLHTWRLWFKWSSFLFHLFYNSCSLELWKISSWINCLGNFFSFLRNSFWIWPAARKTFWEQQNSVNWYFKWTNSWNNFIIWLRLIVVRN